MHGPEPWKVATTWPTCRRTQTCPCRRDVRWILSCPDLGSRYRHRGAAANTAVPCPHPTDGRRICHRPGHRDDCSGSRETSERTVVCRCPTSPSAVPSCRSSRRDRDRHSRGRIRPDLSRRSRDRRRTCRTCRTCGAYRTRGAYRTCRSRPCRHRSDGSNYYYRHCYRYRHCRNSTDHPRTRGAARSGCDSCSDRRRFRGNGRGCC
mmetsp:Transcript_28416/g.62470  ORF Transcript_28416/g.62470 Transcript_28416/m.62470 type:complete len:206 (+) Transcript_28416:2831-3448(+)